MKSLNKDEDMAKYKLIASEHEAIIKLLGLINSDNNLQELIELVTGFMQDWSGCEAVGIRLRDGDDFPYFETRGFPAKFVHAENTLCDIDEHGEVIRDSVGNAVLECMCGNIIRGRFDPTLPCFTENGSFWTNSTSELLASTSEEDRQARTCNRCNGEGYESVARIPLRARNETFGLLQFNDPRKGMLTTFLIEMFERLAASISLGLSQRIASQSVRDSERKSRAILESSSSLITLLDRDGIILDCNDQLSRRFNISRDEIMGSCIWDILPEDVIEMRRKNFEHVFETGEPVNMEDCRNGIWNDTVIHPVFDENNKVSAVTVNARDITERKKAEEALRVSECQFRSLIENLSDGVFVHDFDGKILFVNQASCNNTGYLRDELLNLLVFDIDANIVERDDRIRYWFTMGVGESMMFTAEHRRKDGTTYPAEIHLNRMNFEDKPVILAVARDITDRKQTEEKLQEERDRAQKYLDIAGTMFVALNTAGEVTLINKKGCMILGYDENEILGENWFENFVPARIREEILPVSKKILSGEFESVEYYENPIVTKQGEERLIAWHNAIIRDEQGRISGHLSSGEDITEQRRAAEAIIDSEAHIRFLSSITEIVSDSIIVTDINFNIIYINKPAEDLFGYTFDEIKNMKPDILNAEPTADEIQKDIYKSLSEGREYVGESLNKRKDGSTFYCEYQLMPFYDTLSNNIYYIGSQRDITQRKKTENERKSLEKQLRQAQKMEAIGILAGGIAHDFNNILVPIIGFTEMCMDELSENSVVKSNLKHVLTASHRAKELVDRILEFSRQSEKELTPLYLQPIIKEIVKLLRATIPSTIEIRQNIQKKRITIMADPTQIYQIIMNLCTNAYQAMLEKGGILNVCLSEQDVENNNQTSVRKLKTGYYAKLVVSDTGCGMEKNNLEKIFDPYFTTKKFGEGTGLGLSVVYGIVKNYGGDITVSSKPGVGSTFTVYLPAIEAATESISDSSIQRLPRGSEHILLVDDEREVLRIEEMTLIKLGYQVTAIIDSRKALDEFTRHPQVYDLVLTDQMMPQKNGIELSKEILRIRPDIPIIICTGFSDKKIQESAESIGISTYLFKPLLRNELANKVRQVLDNKRQAK